jgi:hypothetical protein
VFALSSDMGFSLWIPRVSGFLLQKARHPIRFPIDRFEVILVEEGLDFLLSPKGMIVKE